eukprot:5034170-Amphidinium_carterae.1
MEVKAHATLVLQIRLRNLQKFEREINIAKQLDHPNVVRLFETFRDAQKIYLVMELCTGGATALRKESSEF